MKISEIYKIAALEEISPLAARKYMEENLSLGEVLTLAALAFLVLAAKGLAIGLAVWVVATVFGLQLSVLAVSVSVSAMYVLAKVLL